MTQRFQRELTIEAKQPVSINKTVPANGPLVLNPNEQQDPKPTKNNLVDISVEAVEDKKGGKSKYDHKSSSSGSVAFPWEPSSKSDGKLVWAVDESEARHYVRVEVKNLDIERFETFINRTMPEVRRTLDSVAGILVLFTLLVVVLVSCACIRCCVCCCLRLLLPKPTLHRMLAVLETGGYSTFGTRTYRTHGKHIPCHVNASVN